MKTVNRIFSAQPTTIFTVMSALAVEHGAINLGQGFPDTDGPEWLRQIAAEAIVEQPNQYPPMMGVADLRAAVAENNRRFYGLDFTAADVVVTAGATEALLASFMALLDPGDEAIVLEPYYDCYAPQIRAAGGVPIFVRLQPPGWRLDKVALRAAFSAKTKLIVLNSPLNPVGRVFSREELADLAEMLEEFDAYAICDEVYEHLIFDGHTHVPLMTLPGMRERCVRIGSAGKTFSMTGWKIGYATAVPALLKPIAAAHQYITFTALGATQIAVAKGLRADDTYYKALIAQMDAGRQLLAQGLADIGFDVLPCEGTYFLTVDFSPLGFAGNDFEFCTWLTKEAKVTAIPLSAFYAQDNGPPPRSLIRFCFAKKEAVLTEALSRLRRALT